VRDADGFDEFYRGTRVRVLQFLYLLDRLAYRRRR
jgi:hypothetical protein